MNYQRVKDELKRFRLLRKIQPHPRLWFREKGDLPELIIAGAQKAGTTFLHGCLSQSPNLFPSPLQKEVHYFDNKYYKSTDWYKKFFEKRPNGEEVNFETSPYYMFHPDVPRRVKKTIPDARIIMILRDPVERACSHYRHEVSLGYESRRFKDAIKDEIEKLTSVGEDSVDKFRDPFYFSHEHVHFTYLERGMYAKQIKRWLKFFDKKKILFINSKNMFKDPKKVIKSVSSFLNIDMWKMNDTARKNSGNYKISIDKKEKGMVKKFMKKYNKQLKSLLGSDFNAEWLMDN